MNGCSSKNKKRPLRVLFNHDPRLVVPTTPPSGDNSDYRFVYLYASTTVSNLASKSVDIISVAKKFDFKSGL